MNHDPLERRRALSKLLLSAEGLSPRLSLLLQRGSLGHDAQVLIIRRLVGVRVRILFGRRLTLERHLLSLAVGACKTRNRWNVSGV